VRKREFKVLGEELLDVWALDVFGLLEFDDLEDLQKFVRVYQVQASEPSTYVNGTETGSMSGSHILVHGLDGIGSGHLAVLLVHVVGTRARIISDPDAEVLDLQWALLRDLAAIRDYFI
jgi:Holliday junction resolvasome RuvABC ATP-dependent DNA helicase subunit